MKRLLLTLLVGLFVVISHIEAQTYYKFTTGVTGRLMTESGHIGHVPNAKIQEVDTILPSIYAYNYYQVTSPLSSYTIATDGNKVGFNWKSGSSYYFIKELDFSGKYPKPKGVNVGNLTSVGIAQKRCLMSQYAIVFTSNIDTENNNYRYLTCTYNSVKYEVRYVEEEGLCLIEVSDDMVGERFYSFEQATGESSEIVNTVKYEDGFTITSSEGVAITTEDLPVVISLSNNSDDWTDDIRLSYTLSGVNTGYYNYEEESGQIILSPEIPDGTELTFTISSDFQYHHDSKRLLAASTTKKTIIVTNVNRGVVWRSERKDLVNNTYFVYLTPYNLTSAGSACIELDISYATDPFRDSGYSSSCRVYCKDKNGVYQRCVPPGFFYDDGSFPTLQLKLMKSDFVDNDTIHQFGNLPLTRVYQSLIHYKPSLASDYNGYSRGPDLKIRYVPYDLPEVKTNAKFTAGKIHSGGEGIALTFDMPELYKTISPHWGTWTAKITPAFEKMDQATLEEQYAWAHKNNDFADRWWEDTFDTEKEYVCTFDTENKQLLIPEFNPSTSGMYHITLHASPMKEGYPYPFPFNDKTWDFDFAYHPDHTGLELATQIPYTDNEWEWTAVTHNGTWYGPSPEIPERKEAWKHLSVKPRGGYVDVWYKDISTGASKAAPQAVPARAASPADDGYKLMDGNYIDASNMNKIRLMVSKNGAVNPNVTDVNLARLDLSQTGVESIDAAAEGEAEYYHLDGRRATGELTPGLYIRSQGGITSKVVVRR